MQNKISYKHKPKMNKFYLFATSLTLLLSACSNDTNSINPQIPEGDIKALSLSVDIEAPVAKSGTSAYQAQFDNEITTANLDHIGVHICVHNTFGTEYTAGSYNTKWTKGGKWTPASPIFLGSANANIYAYYPHNQADGVNVSSIAIGVGTTDYLFGKATDSSNGTFIANNQNFSASVKMKHAMSQVVWNFTKEDTYVGAAIVQSISINKLNMTGSMNIATGVIIPLTEAVAHSLTPDLTIPGSMNLMIIPSTYENKTLAMTFVIDGKSMTSTLPATTFERGKKYNFNVKMKSTGIVIESVTVEDWATGSDTDLEIS